MVEFIVFSDIHFYQNANKSRILENSRYSWFQQQLDIVEHDIFGYAKKNNVDTVFFGGDLFEDKNRISQNVYNDVWDLFEKLSKDFRIILNIGNHDIYNIKFDSSLKPFSNIVEVVSYPKDFEIGNSLMRVIPFGLADGDSLKLPADKKYDRVMLLTHEDISGLKWSAYNKAFLTSTPLKREIFGDWDIVFNGHIHYPQDLKNIVNIGSCMRHDFGEADDKKRFIHYKDGKIKSIDIECPNFYTFDGLNDKIKRLMLADDINFYRVNADSSMLGDEVFQKFNVFVGIVKNEEREVRLQEAENDDEILQKYIDISETTLNKDKLYSTGKELMREEK